MNVGGSIISLRSTPSVSPALLRVIHSWREAGTSEDDVDWLRTRCVPTGYTPHLWNSSKCVNSYTTKLIALLELICISERSIETKEDKLQSLLATTRVSLSGTGV